jgi:DNA-binding GntR family transcriptional regulator
VIPGKAQATRGEQTDALAQVVLVPERLLYTLPVRSLPVAFDPGMAMEREQGQNDQQVALERIVGQTRVQYTTVGDMVYAVLRQAILNGVFGPGEHLRQDLLAETIGVSRMPVRSALLQLESEGLVSFHPHRGAVVTILTPDQVRETYRVRLVLESHALREAIENMSEERLRLLQQLASEMDREQDGERFMHLRFQFYRELYDEEKNPLLVSLIERLRNDVGRYWLRQRVVDRAEPTHSGLLKYVRRRDAEGAVRWLQNHLMRIAEKLVGMIEMGSRADPIGSSREQAVGSGTAARTGTPP